MVASVSASTRLRLLLLLLLMAGGPTWAVETIRSTAAVRSMPPKEAALGLPVEIRGMVTFSYPSDDRGNFIVEQGGVSIFVNIKDHVLPLDASGRLVGNGLWPVIGVGTEVVVTGITAKGLYAPVVNANEIRILERMTPPPPHSFVLSDVLTGLMDCQRLELRGVVQGAEFTTTQGPMLRLELAVPGGRMVVECFPPGPWTPAKLLGATIRVTAVCMVYFNVRGESLGVHFVVGQPDHIIVEKPAPADPFAVPKVGLNALQVFSPAGPNLERVQIVGQATLSRPGEYFYLEHGGRAVRVFTREKTRFEPGEWVIASGFIDLHQSFAELREAEVRRLGPGTLLEPPLLTHKGLLASAERKWNSPAPVDYNGRLITLRGSLSKIEPTEDGGRQLLLSTDGGSVAVTLDAGGGANALDALLPGSGVQVTGVCELQFPSTQLLTDFPNPTAFSLQLRSPADLRVLDSASWWTPKRLWILLGSTAVLLSLVSVWNLLLRRLVKKRSSQLAAETRARDRAGIEYDATLRERTRLAADLHDTLEQALTGLAFQLDTSRVLSTKAPASSARHLELGRQLLTRSREDLRRSIWNLRARALEDNSFADAVRAVAEQAAEGRPVLIAVEEHGEPCPLPEFIAGNLLLLAQEAMTNAMKHGQAETVTVRVTYDEGWLTLGIHDDGRGFNPRSAPGLQEGHFGLQGMRERANRLDGSVRIESKPGKGASISVRVPIPTLSNEAPEKGQPAGAGSALS